MSPRTFAAISAVLLLTVCAASGTAGSRLEASEPVDGETALVTALDVREDVLEPAEEAGGGGSSWSGDPAKMFAVSLVVPGSGQLLQGNKRGYLFLLAEAALWGGFYVLETKGSDERDDYEDFADANWDYAAYYSWYQEYCVDCVDCAGDYDCRPLATYGTQEYYEDIGKYATYWRWWNIDGDESYIEWDGYSDLDVGVRDEYWDMRGDSNRHLRQARYAMMAAFLNHIVAAVDSYFSARAGGDDEATTGELGIEFDVPDAGEGLSCALVARY
jgi:outer membrane receptor protein involved in Fe transport